MDFQESVAEYLKHHTAREMADYCECIPSSVTRWALGISKPLPGMQREIINYIDELRVKESW